MAKITNEAAKTIMREWFKDGAQGGNRTRKPVKARDFKSLVYTNSTTCARTQIVNYMEAPTRVELAYKVLQTSA